jgi:hypothetical protein
MHLGLRGDNVELFRCFSAGALLAAAAGTDFLILRKVVLNHDARQVGRQQPAARFFTLVFGNGGLGVVGGRRLARLLNRCFGFVEQVQLIE